LSGRRTATPKRDRSVTQWVGYDQAGEVGILTRHRIGNVLATVAAIIGLVLVFSGARQQGHDDDVPSTPAPPSQVAPAVPGR
jgi:hypothetical protein